MKKILKPLKSGRYLTCPDCGEWFSSNLHGQYLYRKHFSAEHLVSKELKKEKNPKYPSGVVIV